MKNDFQDLTAEFRDEYKRRENSLFRSRVELYCWVATFLYFAVSFQYVVRKWFFGVDTFRIWELSLWFIVLVGSLSAYLINRRAKKRATSKLAVLVYTGAFLWASSGLAVVYPENIQVSVFYYAFALILSSLMIPWRLTEILAMGVLYSGAYLIGFDYIVYVMKYPVESLPRFHLPLDGLIFMAISCFICVVIRRKESQRDQSNYALLKKIESQGLQIERELDLARRVHRTLVPNSFSHEKADIWVSYIPMSYVSGDYAKFRFVDEDRLLVFISDVTGHGVAAALLVNRVHAEFERLSQKVVKPGELLDKLNDFILRDFEGTNMYLSAFCGLLDFKARKFTYSNYGHPSQYLFRQRDSRFTELSSQATLLGISVNADPGGAEKEFDYEEGDRVLLFTDGVIETANTAGEPYGEKRLKEFLRQNDALTDAGFNERLIEDLSEFSKGSFEDDIFILNVKTKKTVNIEQTRRTYESSDLGALAGDGVGRGGVR